MTRHFLDVDDLSPVELTEVLSAAAEKHPEKVYAGKGVALLFEKPSARTRNSTEIAVVQLGGHPVTMRNEEVGIDTRETAEDFARTMACYHAAICARVFDHRHLERMAAVVDIPVVNLLSDRSHPCQGVADVLTLQDHFGHTDGLDVAYVGDWNNVARSLGLAVGLAGGTIRFGCPPDYQPGAGDLAQLERAGAGPRVYDSAIAAASGADAVYTDVWTSMGQEEDAAARRLAFQGWMVTPEVMGAADPAAVFLHCLPAHRGEEVDGAVIDGHQSLVWQQAANRLYAVRGVLAWLCEYR